jgi:cysteine desulfurase/selenocysteine lyase
MAAPALADFPVLESRPGLVYLDSAATSQTPRHVIEAMDAYYLHTRASVHRGVYPLAAESTELFEGARARIAAFTGSTAGETVFTRNATEALNLVARGTAGPGDVVLLTEMEHHSNLVPWQMTGAELRYVPIERDGRLAFDESLLDGVKVFAFTHVSNVLGTLNPVADLVALARERGVITVIDGSQAVPHLRVDLAALGHPDFYAWTAHKAYGPTGIGVLHGRRELLEEMPPFLGGGHMISRVEAGASTWAEPPAKFEAGTSPIAEALGLGAAVDYLSAIGMETVWEHSRDVTAYALERLADFPGLTLHGPPAGERGALVSFSLEGVHPHDIAEIIAREGVCVRAGHHCAQVLMKRLGTPATTRASFALHSTRAEVDKLVDALHTVRDVFRL